MTTAFQANVFQPDAFQIGFGFGLGLAEEEPIPVPFGRPIIDFVISPPYYMHEIQTYRNSLGLAVRPPREFAGAIEEQEMMQVYAMNEAVEMMKLYSTYSQ